MTAPGRLLPSLLGLAVAALTCVAMTAPGSATAAHAATPARAQPGQHGGYTVTLVTGDKVTVLPAPNGKQAVVIAPAKGREHLQFSMHRIGTGLSVIPADALPLIAADRLDSRLFDVQLLHTFGYDDAHMSELPVITSGPTGSTVAPAALAGSRSVLTVPDVGLTSLRVRKSSAPSFWSAFSSGARGLAPAVRKLWLVGQKRPTLDVSVPQIGAPEAWKAGYTGTGVSVAVIDTGVDDTHPDLKGVVADAKDFTNSPSGTADDFGHGTHVASTIAGRGTASNGRYTGVAKGATVLNAKVCGSSGTCADDAILAGMQWAIQKGARVVNMSLGGGPTEGDDVLALALNFLSQRFGTLFVVAAGNFGVPESIGSPGTADEALTVGSVDKGTENLSSFSSRGPRVTPSRRMDYGLKPDITAPGGNIVAARAAGTWMGNPIDDYYTEASGTSMATPHVAGSAAILASQHPGWRAEQLKAALMSSAKPNPTLSVYEQGAGRVDVGKAVQEPVIATGGLSLGYFPWPGTGAPEQTKSITYTNTTASDVTLKLALTATDEHGKAAAPGLFTLGASSVTVPAAGTADVPVTVHPKAGAVGLYGGAVTANSADGAVAVHTAIGAYKEPESYNLTTLQLPRDGRNGVTELMVVNTRTGESVFHSFPGSSDIIRMRAGNYVVSAMTVEFSRGPGDNPGTVLDTQTLAMTKTGSHELTLDNRQAKQITFHSAKDAATEVMHSSTVMVNVRAAGKDSGVTYWDFGDNVYAVPGSTKIPGFSYGITAQLIKQGSGWQGNPGGPASPYLYNFAIPGAGSYPADPSYVATPSTVAAVTQKVHRQSAGEGHQTYTQLYTPAGGLLLPSWPVYLRNLDERTDYFMTGPGATAATWLAAGSDNPAGSPGFEQFFPGPQRHYQPGTTSVETWNAAVFGPGLGAAGTVPTRTGDAVKGAVGLLSDAQHFGDDAAATGHASLTRDGTVIWQADSTGVIDTPVPPEAASYALSVSLDREHTWTKFSPHVDAVWTFRSAHTTTPTALPLQVVRFRPALDASNLAPAGAYTFPLRVERAAGAAAATVASVSLEVSYDGGKTWTAATLSGSGANRTAHLVNPAGGSVSLRAVATDSAGNTVKQAIIDAYLVR